MIQDDCSCVGTAIDEDGDGVVCGLDCDDTNVDIGAVGSSCNDGDACTGNDTVTDSCECEGTPIDEDGDGVSCELDCDDSNVDIGAIGDSCNDGDPCTEDDTFDADCNCVGTPIDADNDGISCELDCDDNNADIGQVGSPCDDGDPNTENEVVLDDCSCGVTTCYLEITKVEVSPCIDEENQTYVVVVGINYTNAQVGDSVTIVLSDGLPEEKLQQDFVIPENSEGSATFMLTDLLATGEGSFSINVNAFFKDNTTCGGQWNGTYNSPFSPPACDDNCDLEILCWKVLECDSNKYDLQVTIGYHAASNDSITITTEGGEKLLPINGNIGESRIDTILVEDLVANGKTDIDIVAFFIGNANNCNDIFENAYNAPESCVPCEGQIDSSSLTVVPMCNLEEGNYQLNIHSEQANVDSIEIWMDSDSIKIIYLNDGLFSVEDSIVDLVPDGNTHEVTLVYFSEPNCIDTLKKDYTAPLECNVECTLMIDNILVGNCIENMYNINVAISYESLIENTILINGMTYTVSGTGKDTLTIENLEVNGQINSIEVSEIDTTCSVSQTYNVPEPCICNIEFLSASLSCENVFTGEYTLTVFLDLQNLPENATNIVINDTIREIAPPYIFNIPVNIENNTGDYTVNTYIQGYEDCTENTTISIPLCDCDIEIDAFTLGSCNVEQNTYELSIDVSYFNLSNDSIVVNIMGEEVLFQVNQDSTMIRDTTLWLYDLPIETNITNLTDISVYVVNNAGCNAIEEDAYFISQVCCPHLDIPQDSITTTLCDSLTNYYTATIGIEYEEGKKDSLNINGQTFPTDGTGYQTFILDNLNSDGELVDVIAFWVNDTTCTDTLLSAFEAPDSCEDDCTLLPPTITNDTEAICSLSTILTATPTGGTWTAEQEGVTFSPEDSDSTTVTVLEPGEYTFTYTLTEGDCSESASITLTFDCPTPIADPLWIDLEPSQTEWNITVEDLLTQQVSNYCGTFQVLDMECLSFQQLGVDSNTIYYNNDCADCDSLVHPSLTYQVCNCDDQCTTGKITLNRPPIVDINTTHYACDTEESVKICFDNICEPDGDTYTLNVESPTLEGGSAEALNDTCITYYPPSDIDDNDGISIAVCDPYDACSNTLLQVKWSADYCLPCEECEDCNDCPHCSDCDPCADCEDCIICPNCPDCPCPEIILEEDAIQLETCDDDTIVVNFNSFRIAPQGLGSYYMEIPGLVEPMQILENFNEIVIPENSTTVYEMYIALVMETDTCWADTSILIIPPFDVVVKEYDCKITITPEGGQPPYQCIVDYGNGDVDTVEIDGEKSDVVNYMRAHQDTIKVTIIDAVGCEEEILLDRPESCIINMKVYPNPNNGEFFIEMPWLPTEDRKIMEGNEGKQCIYIYGVDGRVVYMEMFEESYQRYLRVKALQNMPTGMYILQVVTDRYGVFTEKIQKIHDRRF